MASDDQIADEFLAVATLSPTECFYEVDVSCTTDAVVPMHRIPRPVTENLERHSDAIDELRRDALQIKGSMARCVFIEQHADLSQRHANLSERLSRLETSSDCRSPVLQRSTEAHDSSVGDAVQQQLTAIHDVVTEVQAKIGGFTPLNDFVALSEQVDHLDTELSEAYRRHSRELSNLDGWTKSLRDDVSRINDLLSESADRHSQSVEKLGFFEKMESRLQSVEGMLSKWWMPDKVEDSAALGDSKDIYNRLGNFLNASSELEQRVDKHAQALEELSESHGRCEQLSAKVEDLTGKMETCVNADPFGALAMNERVSYIERFLQDSAEKQSKAFIELKDSVQNLEQVGGEDTNEEQQSLEKRLSYLEKFLGECTASQKRALKDLQEGFDRQSREICTALRRLQSLRDGFSIASGMDNETIATLFGEAFASDDSCTRSQRDHDSPLERRVDFLENLMSDHVEQLTRDVEAAHGKLYDLKFTIAKSIREESAGLEDKFMVAMEQRLNKFEVPLGDAGYKERSRPGVQRLDGSSSTNGLGDIEARFRTMQEEQRLARESEHRARQVFQDSLMEVLAQERCTRESEWRDLERRMAISEKKMMGSVDGQLLQVDLAPPEFGRRAHASNLSTRRCVGASPARQNQTPPRTIISTRIVQTSQEPRPKSPTVSSTIVRRS